MSIRHGRASSMRILGTVDSHNSHLYSEESDHPHHYEYDHSQQQRHQHQPSARMLERPRSFRIPSRHSSSTMGVSTLSSSHGGSSDGPSLEENVEDDHNIAQNQHDQQVVVARQRSGSEPRRARSRSRGPMPRRYEKKRTTTQQAMPQRVKSAARGNRPTRHSSNFGGNKDGNATVYASAVPMRPDQSNRSLVNPPGAVIATTAAEQRIFELEMELQRQATTIESLFQEMAGYDIERHQFQNRDVLLQQHVQRLEDDNHFLQHQYNQLKHWSLTVHQTFQLESSKLHARYQQEMRKALARQQLATDAHNHDSFQTRRTLPAANVIQDDDHSIELAANDGSQQQDLILRLKDSMDNVLDDILHNDEQIDLLKESHHSVAARCCPTCGQLWLNREVEEAEDAESFGEEEQSVADDGSDSDRSDSDTDSDGSDSSDDSEEEEDGEVFADGQDAGEDDSEGEGSNDGNDSVHRDEEDHAAADLHASTNVHNDGDGDDISAPGILRVNFADVDDVIPNKPKSPERCKPPQRKSSTMVSPFLRSQDRRRRRSVRNKLKERAQSKPSSAHGRMPDSTLLCNDDSAHENNEEEKKAEEDCADTGSFKFDRVAVPPIMMDDDDSEASFDDAEGMPQEVQLKGDATTLPEQPWRFDEASNLSRGEVTDRAASFVDKDPQQLIAEARQFHACTEILAHDFHEI